MANRVGNDQLKTIYDQNDRLTKEAGDWKKRATAEKQIRDKLKEGPVIL
jgi:hypothetical protein